MGFQEDRDMGEEQDKKQVVEWSFSFENLGNSINEQLRKIGAGDEKIKKEHFATGLAGATSASVELDFSVGRVVVKPLAGSENLIEADIAYTGDIKFEVSGEAEKKVKLAQARPPGENIVTSSVKDAIGKLVNREDLRWDVSLSPAVPLKLDINGGLGEARLDLGGLQLSGLEVDNGVGEMHLNLPASGVAYPVSLNSGVGAMHIQVAQGAGLTLDIQGGVGSVNVTVSPQAAVRLEATSGLGGVDIPAHFKRTKGGSDFISKSGVWETEGYALASHQVQISYNGGVGGFKLKMDGE
jgi:hypothetical protein